MIIDTNKECHDFVCRVCGKIRVYKSCSIIETPIFDISIDIYIYAIINNINSITPDK